VILVDTSVWIELLNRPGTARLSDEQLMSFATCGPVVQEVLQGLRQVAWAVRFREDFLALTILSDPLSVNTFLAAADLYREGRRKGYTIRSSTDCLIAAIAIENSIPVWHKDRDFDTIAHFTSLQCYRR
jgi:predicted nucleic acid-binding protein